MGIASRALRIREGEGRTVAIVMALMFVSMAAIAIGESGIDALFFDRIGTHALPLMYLLQAGATFIAMLALTGVLGRLGPRRTYVFSPVVLGAIVLTERAVLLTHVRWIYPVLWVTVAFAMLGQGIGLWGTAGAVVDARQAKRLFPIFGAGGILGSVIGGLATRPLARAVGAEDLLLIWAAGLAIAIVLCRLALGPAAGRTRRHAARRRASPLQDIARGLDFVRRSRLLVWMAVAAVLFSVLYYSLFLPFAQAASERFPNPEELAGFFGLLWAAITGAAFLISVLLANRLFAWLGVAAMMVVLPLLYAGSFGILLVESGFVAVVAMRVVTGVWLQGVASPAWETLINVVPESQRDQTRAFMNGGPAQFGTAIAGVVALIGQRALTPREFAVIGLIASVATILVAFGIRRSYTDALIDALRAGRPQLFAGPSAAHTPIEISVDAEAARALSASMRSPDVRVRRLAFQLARELPRASRPTDIASGLDDVDPIVRLAAVVGLDLGEPAEVDALLRTIDDVEPSVAAAAAARATRLGNDRATVRLRELFEASDVGARRAAVEQLSLASPDAAAAFAEALVEDPAVDVRAAALERLAEAAPSRAFTLAVAHLGDPDRAMRIAAGRGLADAGPRALEHVLAALNDPRTADGGVEAVKRLNVDDQVERVRDFVLTAAVHATSDHDLAAVIPSDTDGTTLLHDALLERGRRVARSALWATAMLGNRRDAMHMAIENLDSTPAHRANALETLEAVGDPDLVRPLLLLWEPKTAASGDGDWLAAALRDDDAFIRHCAELVRARREGDTMRASTGAISVIERVIFLRQVPLFADLALDDLERVAEIAEERGYADGETIAAEGELGNELHIVVEGVVSVVQDRDGSDHELARRTTGDAVGEMSLITHKPRMASLMASGPARTLRIGHREFESMLRERPDVALAVMRVLAQRLSEGAGHGS
ncbi:MAG: cyclic nucleotide-binding domain-containing protein [Actinomycetota bacterium]|nr:cyclic nucleotide-binding domain-containing protein [Actinomycetota bacterium]